MKKTIWIGIVLLAVVGSFFAVLKVRSNASHTPVGIAQLFDGATYPVGVFRDSRVEGGVKSYSSDKFGISFKYPNNYLLFENKSHGIGGVEYYTIMIAPENFMRQALVSAQATERPPSIYFSFYREPNPSISLEQWIRTKPQSNFEQPSPPGQEHQNPLIVTTVADIPAFKYHVSGLYEADYVAFTYGEWVVLGISNYAGENTARDFQTILSSVLVK